MGEVGSKIINMMTAGVSLDITDAFYVNVTGSPSVLIVHDSKETEK
jgi:hypothetical protein